MSDKSEIQLVTGKGPPILSFEGESLAVGQIVYVLKPNRYHKTSMPQTAQVTAIDLTRRTVRLQVVNGKELLYCAIESSNGGTSDYWICHSDETARQNVVRWSQEYVSVAEKKADTAIEELEDAKARLSTAREWFPKQFGDIDQ